MINTTLKQPLPIFWKGRLCKMIDWDSLNLGGKLRIKVSEKFIEVDISELTN
jgi:hypothetical protein